ncbi:hypothetical protein AHMF7605_11865 [Adhaeribacter arboris]|uniref:Uncharacterized protein n=1 Tax=Adhaeribacter arboris TaxID=2072846 RepID=A0A2T2YFD0_9BACT|nr:hypothetical protein [Adhaeribacter arboris]PSR54168.1 hypothetical protein AHMF7605_11865 [Adhaeribacter arboris]
MKPVPFKESNLNLGAGDNPNTDDMPVAISKDGEEIPFIVSCWKPTPEELAEINRTGEIWLATMGHRPPPIMAVGHNPFKHHGFKALELL